jgi:DNA-binding MarR family transcriptional regulator
MPPQAQIQAHESSQQAWIEKQYARVLEALEIDEKGMLFDSHVRQQMLRSERAGDVGGEALAALRAASHGFRTAMNRWLDTHGLSEGRLTVLWQLYGKDRMTLGDLASSIDVSPRNVTGLVDHLEEDGLVERQPDPEDRRATLVRLTTAGESKLAEVRNDKDLAHTTLIADFSDEELQMLRHLCLKLVRNLATKTGSQGMESL